MARRNRNELLVPGARRSMERLKEETAQEMGIELGADQTARNNGAVGGHMVKNLIRLGEESLGKKK
ncbi:alpha/beta-type small acid-soluble spore protein [Numidum massiliense]|uniref:alpha/beta-type small acid-soluble spore protein n=1 Tax=Numidum massiliense TaxID=1522315 RepID=UPI0006D575F2|nr:alpha/beta-type small acid-soluble spore protein [Numidum massiliense]